MGSTFVPPVGNVRRVDERKKRFPNMGYDPDHNMLKTYLYAVPPTSHSLERQHDPMYLHFYEIVNFLPFVEGIPFVNVRNDDYRTSGHRNEDKGLRKAYFH